MTRFVVAEPWLLVATPTPVAVASIVATTRADRIRLECIHLKYPRR
jgi:hypothetical protein